MTKTSAQHKLARGVEHANVLGREARSFQYANAYEPLVERKVHSAQEVEYRVTARENIAPSDAWPLLAGDVVQNLRAALDHAVYALVPKKHRRSCQFPIFIDACEFQVKGRPLIAGVPTPVRALIENAQPYKSWPDAPYLHPLAILRTLSNLDKHRALATVACAVEIQYIGVKASEIRLEPIRPPKEGQPLYDGAEVIRFIARSDAGLNEMDVNPSFAYQVRIEGHPLLDTLRILCNRVFECLIECESGLPISPFQQGYPIPAF